MDGKEFDPLLRRALAQEAEFLSVMPVLGIDFNPRPSPPGADDDGTARPPIEPARDVARIEQRLRRCPGWESASVANIEEVKGGTSKRTFIVRLRDGRPREGVVIRLDSPTGSGPVDGTVFDEAPILRVLHAVGYPVAEVVWAEADAGLFGSPSLAVEFLPGRASLDIAGTQFGDHAADHARLLAGVIAKLHRIAVDELDLPARLTAGAMRDHITRMLDAYETQWHRRRLSTSAILSTAFTWLRRNIPDRGRRVAIVHGDVSLRNMLFHDGRVSAVLDWETWHVGDPIEDLVYCRRDIERVVPWQAFLDEYYAHGGSEYREDVARFYEIWLQVRNGIMAMSMLWDFDADPQPRDLVPPSICYSYYIHHLRTVARHLSAQAALP